MFMPEIARRVLRLNDRAFVHNDAKVCRIWAHDRTVGMKFVVATDKGAARFGQSLVGNQSLGGSSKSSFDAE